MNSAMATSQGRIRFAESLFVAGSEGCSADAEDTGAREQNSYALLGFESRRTRKRNFVESHERRGSSGCDRDTAQNKRGCGPTY